MDYLIENGGMVQLGTSNYVKTAQIRQASKNVSQDILTKIVDHLGRAWEY